MDPGVQSQTFSGSSPEEKGDGEANTSRVAPMNQSEFLEVNKYHEKDKTTLGQKVSTGWSKLCNVDTLLERVYGLMPILEWLPKYSFRKNLVGDTVSGITVAVMHIPQGMAYAILSGMPAVNGLYMAFFPVLVYVVFCTSRHNSQGSFAIVLLMAGTLAEQVINAHETGTNLLGPRIIDFDQSKGYTPTQAVTMVAFGAGMWQVLMGVLKLGSLSVLLSDVLVSGFTTGSAVHVLTSQLKNIFGLNVPKESKFPKLLRSHYFVITHLLESNVAAIIVSTVAMTFLAVNNDHLKPRLAKKCRIPLPVELIVVVVGTAVSYYLELHDKHGLVTIGSLPTGLPAPSAPPLELLPDVLGGSLVIAVVAYTTSYSMARILAIRQNYEVDANQELLAQGLGNITGAFFRSGPIAASLSRSLIQQTVGGMTQIASIVSCLVLLVILLFIGPLFESLPNCILSSIILVALKGMFVQVFDFTAAWKTSRLDAAIWLSTFLSVVVIDIDIGLGVGVGVSLITLIWRGQRAYACVLAEIPGTPGIYVDAERFETAEEIHNVKIFHYGAGLHFANCDYFKDTLYKLTGLDPIRWHESILHRQKLAMKAKKLGRPRNEKFCCLSCISSSADESMVQKADEGELSYMDRKLRKLSVHVDPTGNQLPFRYLLIDLSGVSFVDAAGINLLKSLVQNYDRIYVTVVFAGAQVPVMKMFEKLDFLIDVPPQYHFPTVGDAVDCSRWKCFPDKPRSTRVTGNNEAVTIDVESLKEE
ncbi:unnamed protein product [Notodromas monacha]|uniref:STAS domain-containing protein n=1 Tax=Notodromas monacha TaxID=399045 RepID=A0A7R9GD36_9CRUS|nr:unnamed protein product [Notodromas monacha]CAG0918293.1 unnamed protein product [Notodromas monacha]